MFIDVQQNSEEWFSLKLGKASSSNFNKVMANEGKAFGNPAIEYAQKLALERVTGERDETNSYTNKYMERGVELEPIAIDLYEIETLYSVANGGFNDHKILGDSPDGNVGKDGCTEVKSVIANTQWKRLKNGGIDPAYKWQVQGHNWLGNKQWCDFISYCPEMPKDKQLYICRVDRDEDMISRMKVRLEEFEGLVKENVKLLKG